MTASRLEHVSAVQVSSISIRRRGMGYKAHHIHNLCKLYFIGIGRVTKGLLLPLGVSQCDLVEPSPRLISSAPDYLGDQSAKCRYFCKGLQDFEPMEQSYDIIWIQWVIGYLTDDDLVEFLKRCAVSLRRGGVVVVKDNTCEQEAFIVDRDDGSSTRSFPYILAIAELAGFRVVYQRFQGDFPTNIFPVPIIALEPRAFGGFS